MAPNLGPNAALIGQPGSAWRLQTPALVVDLDAFERNLARMANWTRDANLRLRPHAKTHKCAEISFRQIELGAVGACCATVREAEALAAAGVPGLLITSAQAPSKTPRIGELLRQGADLTVVVDHPDTVDALGDAARAAGAVLAVMVDLDTGLGRTGVTRAEDALALARRIAACDALEYAGVQAYAGHVQHIAGVAPRGREIEVCTDRLQAVNAVLREANLPPGLISGGGTGSHRLDQEFGVLNEIQAGSYIFMDGQYHEVDIDGAGGAAFETALTVQTSVINVQHEGYAVTDAGLKSFALDGDLPRIEEGAPDGAHYRYKGDEHGAVLFAEAGESLPLGAMLRCLTPHCDPTVNLFDVYHAVRGEVLEAIWPIDARGNP